MTKDQVELEHLRAIQGIMNVDYANEMERKVAQSCASTIASLLDKVRQLTSGEIMLKVEEIQDEFDFESYRVINSGTGIMEFIGSKQECQMYIQGEL